MEKILESSALCIHNYDELQFRNSIFNLSARLYSFLWVGYPALENVIFIKIMCVDYH